MNGRDFWTRRKEAVEAEVTADARQLKQAQSAARDAEVAEQSDAEILAALELPEPESLGEGDDFKVFLTDQIPARIKTRALRHLWRANPVLACVDGLVDYGEDFTDAACVIEGMQTAYQVGKGMTKHVEEMARQAELEAQNLAESTQAESGLSGSSGAEEKNSDQSDQKDQKEEQQDTPILAFDDEFEPPHSHGLAQSAAAASVEPIDTTDIAATAAPRRMRFSFEGASDRA